MTDSTTAGTDHSVNAHAKEELARLRGSIDNIDAAIVHMLAERFKCTQEVGRLKAEYRLPPADPEREREQIERLRLLAENARLDPVFAEKFLNFIIAEVIRHHELIARATPAATAGRVRGAASSTSVHTSTVYSRPPVQAPSSLGATSPTATVPTAAAAASPLVAPVPPLPLVSATTPRRSARGAG